MKKENREVSLFYLEELLWYVSFGAIVGGPLEKHIHINEKDKLIKLEKHMHVDEY